MSVTTHHEKVWIEGTAGKLQGLYQQGKADKPAVVVCHPHPLYGGTMRNKVVYWMARVFEDLGCSVLRFNFRGVEASEGAWDEGRGESDDVIAALNWLEEMNSDTPLWLAGFSFGTYASLHAAQHEARVEALFTVAPAVNIWSFDFALQELRPLTVVSGTADEIVPFTDVQHWIEAMPKHVHFHRIEGAGHFFPQHMQMMMDALSQEANALL